MTLQLITTYNAGPCSDEFKAWLVDHGVDPNHCYKAEVWHDPDKGSILRAYQFAVDESGHHYFDPDDSEKVAEKPVHEVPIKQAAPPQSDFAARAAAYGYVRQEKRR